MRRYSNLEHFAPVLEQCLAARDADRVERPPLPGPRLIKDKLSDDDRDAIKRIIIAQSLCSSKDKIDNYTRFLRLKLAAASLKSLPGVEEGTLRGLSGK